MAAVGGGNPCEEGGGGARGSGRACLVESGSGTRVLPCMMGYQLRGWRGIGQSRAPKRVLRRACRVRPRYGSTAGSVAFHAARPRPCPLPLYPAHACPVAIFDPGRGHVSVSRSLCRRACLLLPRLRAKTLSDWRYDPTLNPGMHA